MKQPADFEKIVLCDDSKSCVEICEEISCLLEEMHRVRKANCTKNIKDNLDVYNLRQEDLVDKLWLALICKCNKYHYNLLIISKFFHCYCIFYCSLQ